MAGIKFQTVVDIPDFNWKTGYQKKNMFIGSCFTEHIGNKMAGLKYPVDLNPFGILYNPESVANGLLLLLQNKKFEKKDLIEHDGLWHSFFHHGRFSAPDAGETLKQINERINFSAEFLKSAEFLFITFGTSWIYRYKKTGQIVSNCHKIPNREFDRFRLSPEEIAGKYIELIPEIRKQNPNLKLIFTVSPVRHWKDGAIENMRSKAALLLAIDKITGEFGKNSCGYFPSYEIMMDELRDYRFYAGDMIHISDAAINHIWENFQIKLIDKESINLSKEVQKIINAVNHKAFNKFTKEHLLFLEKTLTKCSELEQKYPNIKFKLEKEFLTKQINEIKAAGKQN